MLGALGGVHRDDRGRQVHPNRGNWDAQSRDRVHRVRCGIAAPQAGRGAGGPGTEVGPDAAAPDVPAARDGEVPAPASADAVAGPTWQAYRRAAGLSDGLRADLRSADCPADQSAGGHRFAVWLAALRLVLSRAGLGGRAAGMLPDAGWLDAGWSDAQAGAGHHRRRGHLGADAVFGRDHAISADAGRSVCPGGRSALVGAAEPVRAWGPER